MDTLVVQSAKWQKDWQGQSNVCGHAISLFSRASCRPNRHPDMQTCPDCLLRAFGGFWYRCDIESLAVVVKVAPNNEGQVDGEAFKREGVCNTRANWALLARKPSSQAANISNTNINTRTRCATWHPIPSKKIHEMMVWKDSAGCHLQPLVCRRHLHTFECQPRQQRLTLATKFETVT